MSDIATKPAEEREWERVLAQYPILPGCVAWACFAGRTGERRVAYLRIDDANAESATCTVLCAEDAEHRLRAAAPPVDAFEQADPLQVPLWALHDVAPPQGREHNALRRAYLAHFFRSTEDTITTLATLAARLSDLFPDAGTSAEEVAEAGMDLMLDSTGIAVSPASCIHIEGICSDLFWEESVAACIATARARFRASYTGAESDSDARDRVHLLEVDDIGVCLTLSLGEDNDEGCNSSMWLTWMQGDAAARERFFLKTVEDDMRRAFRAIELMAVCLWSRDHARRILAELSDSCVAICTPPDEQGDSP